MTTLERQYYRYFCKAVRFVGGVEGVVDGYLAVWGDPAHRDSYGTYFDPEQPPELGLMWDEAGKLVPIRLLYEHGEDGQIDKDIVGRIVRIWRDQVGIGFRALLDKTKPYAQRLIDELRAGLLGISSASAKHLADWSPDGRFEDWLLSEVSLTKFPSEPRMPAATIRSELPAGESAETGDDPGDRGDGAGAAVQSSDEPKQPEKRTMLTLEELGLQTSATLEEVVAALIDKLGQDAAVAMLNGVIGGTNAPATPDANTPPEGMSASDEQPTTARADVATVLRRLLPQAAPIAPAAPNGELAALRTELAALRTQMMTAPAQTPPAPVRMPAPITAVRDLRFDSVEPHILAYGYQIAKAVSRPLSEKYMRALTLKTAQRIEGGDKTYGEIRSSFNFSDGRPIRAAEVMGTADTGNGAEWAEDLPGTVLWEAIRQETPLLQALQSKGMDVREIPPGYKSETIPLDDADQTWYVAPEATDEDASSGQVTPTYASSKFGTAEKQITVAKLSTRTPWSNEEEEDSIIRFSEQAVRKITVTAPERVEYILLNGDTATGASVNINLIDGTPAAAPTKPDYMLLNGFLKLALVTNSTNAIDCGATFDETDFLKTLLLLPAKYRTNRAQRLLFVMDSDTEIAAMNIPSIKTRDVFSAATIENGVLTRIFGIDVLPSGFMGLGNTAGKVSGTPANNILGRLAAIRPDRWTFRWKRRLQVVTEYKGIPDAWTVIGHMRFGLAYYDNEAAAVTYNIPETLA